MEFGRLIGLLRPRNAPIGDPKSEVAESEIKRWEEAFLGNSLFHEDVFAILLALRTDPRKKVYASFVVGSRRISIDIPLIDHTPQEILAQKAYETTFFGEVDPDKYRSFATGEFTRDHLLALLNRTKAGVPLEETASWFNTTFDVKHHKPDGSVFFSSFGGQGTYGYDYKVTIEHRSQIDDITGKRTISFFDFIRSAQKALPNIDISPLSVDAYLQEVKSTLKFLPRDWGLPVR